MLIGRLVLSGPSLNVHTFGQSLHFWPDRSRAGQHLPFSGRQTLALSVLYCSCPLTSWSSHDCLRKTMRTAAMEVDRTADQALRRTAYLHNTQRQEIARVTYTSVH